MGGSHPIDMALQDDTTGSILEPYPVPSDQEVNMGSTTKSIEFRNLTLYRANGTCSLIPHAILRHYKIPFIAIELEFGPDGLERVDRSSSNAEHRSLHPRIYVPALLVDKEFITEMPAVLSFISSLIPEENLFGIGPIQQAKVLEWLVFLSGTLHGLGYRAWLRPGRFSDDVTAHDKIHANGGEVIHESFKRIDEGLGNREFIVGDALTVVDFNVYIFARWAHEVGIDLEKEYNHYYEHVKKIERMEGGLGKLLKVRNSSLHFLDFTRH